MARRPMVLVTGGSGEMAHGLIHRFAEDGVFEVLALDVRPLEPELARRCAVSLTGDIRDRHVLERIRSEFEIHAIYHLAAILSTRLHLLPAEKINAEMEYLRIAISKTAGPAEEEAWSWIEEKIGSALKDGGVDKAPT